MKHEQKRYRNAINPQGLVRFEVLVQETDIAVYAKKSLISVTRELVLESRSMIEKYIEQYPEFAKTLFPWAISGPAPRIIRRMSEAGMAAGVGPMAAVAGAVAEFVGNGLIQCSDDVIVENGGDIYIRCNRPITVGIYAGHSPLSHKMGIKIFPTQKPIALCTSSGKVGHSLSLGKADAVSIMADDCSLADAVATATANQVQTEGNLTPAADFAKKIKGVKGVLIICGEAMAAWGDIQLLPV